MRIWIAVAVILAFGLSVAGCGARAPQGQTTADLSQAQAGKSEAPLEGYALLVGCSKYDNLKNEAKVLHGVTNDLPLVRRLLTGPRFKFDPARVTTLAESGGKATPTREHILHELQALVQQDLRGKLVVIYLGGHGTQVPDDGLPADDFEPDGLDEAFCPEDAGVDSSGTFTNIIRDDELHNYFQQMVKRGAFVWLIADCCFSGTLDRASAEGVGRSLGPEDFGVPRQATVAPKSRGAEKPEVVPGDFVALYAAQPYERTYEVDFLQGSGKPEIHSILTYALCAELEVASTLLTYRQLAQQIRGRYLGAGRSYPIPYVDGNIDRIVMRPGKVGQADWQLGRADDEWRVNAGQLHDLTSSSILAVYPAAEAEDGNKLLGYVKVERAEAFSSIVTPVEHRGTPVRSDFPEQNRCELAFLNFGEASLSVAVDDKTQAGQQVPAERLAELRSKLAAVAAPPASDNPEASLVKVADSPTAANWLLRVDGNKLLLVPCGNVPGAAASADRRQFSVPENDLANGLQSRLKRVARATNLVRLASVPQQALVHGELPLRINVELVRLKAKEDKKGEPIDWRSTGVALRPGTKLGLKVENQSWDAKGNGIAVEISILFIDSQFGITYAGENFEEQSIEPRESLMKYVGELGEETNGEEHIVVIAQPATLGLDRVDAKFLVQPPLEAPHGNDEDSLPSQRSRTSPLEDLLRMTKDPSRGDLGETVSRSRPKEAEYALALLTFTTLDAMRPGAPGD